EVVDQGAPVAMESLPRVGVLVEAGAVEPAETVRVGREMRRHPVDQHTDAGLVAAVDEPGEAFGRAEPPGWREQADRLVAPGAGERVLADRQALDVREAEVTDIRNELVRDLVPVDRAAVGAPAPGAEVD